MTTSPSVNIIGVDMSYRNTGVCWMTKEGSVIKDVGYCSIENGPIKLGFDGLQEAAYHMMRLVDKIVSLCGDRSVVLIEVPSYSQENKSAVVSGMCWMAAKMIEEKIGLTFLIDPSILKTWSHSVKGDKKEKVKEMVLNRLPVRISNDNIIDAAGICLMFSDEISLQKHEQNSTN